jgi:aspartate kinase
LINITGAQMIGRPGVARAIFSALGEYEVNIMMISQGSSEVNISFVVKQDDGQRAVRVLHKEFGLGEEI